MDLSDFVNTYTRFMQRKYGRRMQRVPLSTGIPCPHRKCVFCRPDTFTDPVAIQDVETQFLTLTTRMRKTFPDCGWIPYFNAETATHGLLPKLKRIFQIALQQQDAAELALSTRPDAIDDHVAAMLKSLDAPVTVEIGMQTIHDRSLEVLRRGHSFRQCVNALKLLHAHGIRTGAHLILGIPGESMDDMLQTVRWISASGLIDEVKFHQLVAYRDTELERMHRNGGFIPLTTDACLSILTGLLPELDERIVVSRLFTSNVRRSDVAILPGSGSKLEAMNELVKRMQHANIKQGVKWNADSNASSKRFDANRT